MFRACANSKEAFSKQNICKDVSSHQTSPLWVVGEWEGGTDELGTPDGAAVVAATTAAQGILVVLQEKNGDHIRNMFSPVGERVHLSHFKIPVICPSL